MTQPPDETFAEPGTAPAAPTREDEGQEGGKTAPGPTTATTGQLDGASGGYGTQSGEGSSTGSGDGEPADSGSGDAEPGGATGEPPTDWLRRA
jgi:hypothetical protein